jgi:hypothetical protein
VNNRNQFTYYQGMEHIGTYATPKIQNRSYTITTTIDRENKKTDGVLVAHGDHLSGYTLYIKGDKLVYEYNLLGTIFKMVSKEKVPMGESTIQFEFQKTGNLQGKAFLMINGKQVGEVDMPKTFKATIAEEGLDIGKDMLRPVSPDYGKGKDFKFSGKIEKVEYHLKND